ncbi:hypothetical protein DSO57_1007673 [Entomophthora muscae]|uniref:Uncharacterized protein n=1 Tax=Entomophthora muscae TaxID=34485 RepID=A0ACC2T7H2_9FUNG|nr:hypothetical protein DSO57_1007673 [Entomophthora muscae]
MNWSLTCYFCLLLLCMCILLLSMYLVFKKQPHLEFIGNFLIAQMIFGILIYVSSALIVCFSFFIHEDKKLNPVVVQFSGVLNNTGILILPYTVAFRYFYYFWVVVLDYHVNKVYWLSFCALIWVLVLGLGISQALLSLFHLRDNFQSTSPFFLQVPLVRANTLTYITIILVAGTAHLFFSGLILFKFITSSSDNSRNFSSFPLAPTNKKVSKTAIILKFVPVTIVYLFTHVPALVMTLIELISGRPSNLYMQWANTCSYAVASLLAPILIIFTNRSMLISFKSTMLALVSKFY